MAPPQQAGKFKPRKPGKKIQPGSTISPADAAGPTPVSVGSSSITSGGGGGRGGRDGRGRGRGRGRDGGRGGREGGRGGRDGGRGGGRRGGGRMPIQQGQTFFTAPPATAHSSKSAAKTGGLSKTAAAVARRLQASAEASAAGGGGGPGAGGGGANDILPQEEIVGMLDEAVGSGVGPDKVGSGRILDRENMNETEQDQQAEKKQSFLARDESGFTYDSDSSRESLSRGSRKTFGFRTPKMPDAAPVTLPFPDIITTPGIGHDYVPRIGRRTTMDSHHDSENDEAMMNNDYVSGRQPVPSMARSQSNLFPQAPPVSAEMDAATAAAAAAAAAASAGSHYPSPFVSVTNKRGLEQELNSWFLVQLPTRLPPVRSALQRSGNNDDNQGGGGDGDDDGDGDGDDDKGAAAADGSGGNNNNNNNNNNANTDEADLQQTARLDTAEVATPPVRLDCFDNTLSSAVAGKMGKIQVHKSGKTVLLLQAADGTTTRLNVSQGLSCVFQQQAAIIDTEQSKLVPLGQVGKTLVVTPDLDWQH